MLREFSLKGKVALVTGAGRGIGQAISVVFAEAGADVIAVARTKEQIEATAAQVRQLGQKALAIPTDVTQVDQVEAMAKKAITEFGRIDILVNNAGTAIIKPLVPLPGFNPPGADTIPHFFHPISNEEWRQVMDTNLTGIFYCTRAVGPYMLERRKGKVINVTSVEGAKGFPYHIIYTSSKGAVNLFTRTLALEWARYNINVNAIAPGFFHTAMSARDHEDPKLRERIIHSIPLRRTGNLRDLGLLALYLASEASDYMTGQIIYLDGGFTA